MSMFLDKVIVNGVQDPCLTPFEDFLPRSAPLFGAVRSKVTRGVG